MSWAISVGLSSQAGLPTYRRHHAHRRGGVRGTNHTILWHTGHSNSAAGLLTALGETGQHVWWPAGWPTGHVAPRTSLLCDVQDPQVCIWVGCVYSWGLITVGSFCSLRGGGSVSFQCCTPIPAPHCSRICPPISVPDSFLHWPHPLPSPNPPLQPTPVFLGKELSSLSLPRFTLWLMVSAPGRLFPFDHFQSFWSSCPLSYDQGSHLEVKNSQDPWKRKITEINPPGGYLWIGYH